MSHKNGNVGFDKEQIKEFFKWLESTTDENLRDRRRFLLQYLEDITDESIRGDIKFCLRRIDHEILTRDDIYRLDHEKGA